MGKLKSFFTLLFHSVVKILKKLGVFLQSRQLRFGRISLLSFLLIVGILVLVNLMVRTTGIRWDLTKNKLYSLSDETIRVIKGLKNDVSVQVFVSNSNQTADLKEQIRKLLDEYTVRTSRITYKFVDPYANQQLALQYGVQREGTVVFTSGTKVEQTTNITEQDFTSALIKLQSTKKPTIVFWIGNGAKNPEHVLDDGYSEVRSTLERLNYVVSVQDNAKDPVIAESTDVLVIAGPRVPFVSKEVEAVASYLEKGGKLLVLFEALENFQSNGLEAVLAKYGIAVKQGSVIDPQIFFRNPAIPGVATYPRHQITQNLDKTVYVGPIMVAPADIIPEGVQVESIVKTSPQSWLETKPQQNAVLDTKSGDVEGPVSIAVAMKYTKADSDPKKATRIVAIGDSDSGTNLVVQFNPRKDFFVPGNLDLIANSINWLTSQENLISIAPKDTSSPTMTLSSQQSQQIQYFVLGVIPSIFIILSLFVAHRRKRHKAV